MVELKVRKVGNSLGITIPEDVARELGVGEGDRLFIVEGADGMWLTRDPEFKRKMKALDRTMDRYDDTLKRLPE